MPEYPGITVYVEAFQKHALHHKSSSALTCRRQAAVHLHTNDSLIANYDLAVMDCTVTEFPVRLTAQKPHTETLAHRQRLQP